MLIWLDLSSAVDTITIDQTLLLNRLRAHFLLKKMFFTRLNRIYLTVYKASQWKRLSQPLHLSIFGVPLLYTFTPFSIISAYHLDFYMHADDTQIYFPVTDNTKDDIIPRVEASVKDIKEWMILNGFKLNKTLLICTGITVKEQK